jgi:hypothetical protein
MNKKTNHVFSPFCAAFHNAIPFQTASHITKQRITKGIQVGIPVGVSSQVLHRGVGAGNDKESILNILKN